MTKCQNWSSWLYSLVSNLLLFTIYDVTWIESASDIYISLFISKTLLFLQNYFMILSYFIFFIVFSRSFHIILYMDLRPWEAILARKVFYCIPIG